MRARGALAALALAALSALAPPTAAFAADAVRVQADGAAPLPPFVPGGPAAKRPTAEELRALRQTALANGVDRAVLEYAAQVARADVRGDEGALRAALGGGALTGFSLGQGVLSEIGPREAKPKLKPGDPPPKPRKPREPVPMEHAWRIEVLVDAPRVKAAIEAAGLGLASGADSGALTEVLLEAPYDAPMLAALRAKLTALGASGAVPRRFEAQGVTLSVLGLPAHTVSERLAADPPAGYAAEVKAPVDPVLPTRVRLRPSASAERTKAPARRSP